MLQFGGFKPEAQKRIANRLGYFGDMSMFNTYLAQNPDKQMQMQQYNQQAINMVRGGMARKNYQTGGLGADDTGAGDTGLSNSDIYEDTVSNIEGSTGLDLNDGAGDTGAGDTGSGDTFDSRSDVNESGVMSPLQTSGQPQSIAAETSERLFQPGLPFGGQVQVAGIQESEGQILGDKVNVPNLVDALQQAFDKSAQGFKVSYNSETGNLDFINEVGDIVTSQPPEVYNTKSMMDFFSETLGESFDPRDLIDEVGGQVDGTIKAVVEKAGEVDPDTKEVGGAFQATASDAPEGGPEDATTTGTKDDVASELAEGKFDAQTGEVSQTIDGVTQDETMISSLEAEQGEYSKLENPVTRKIEEGELVDLDNITGQAEKAAKFTEQIQAAEATPSVQATVAGQLEQLTEGFDAGNPPAWAAAGIRQANAALAKRGLSGSSLAGQAVIQAMMEQALPIAQADAATFSRFEERNLSNRQQRAMLAAEQRAAFIGQEFDQAFQARVLNAAKVSDIANMNFTAEQNIALENSRAANTMNMANLSNKQALVMAQAAALGNLDMANLSNLQQAAVQNAQNFLQMDMANLSNQQQAEMFSATSRVQSIFNDAAAKNAMSQFNAREQNQSDQFFANLATTVSQFNAAQSNAMSQFNAQEKNVIERFNKEVQNQREQFNAKNRLVIDQSNAVWRREIATSDTAAINRANELNAAAVLGISNTAYNNLWQYYADSMEYAYLSTENERSRVNELAKVKLVGDADADIAALKNDYASSAAFGQMVTTLLFSDYSMDNTIIGDIFEGLGFL
jgi:hypothetical protein